MRKVLPSLGQLLPEAAVSGAREGQERLFGGEANMGKFAERTEMPSRPPAWQTWVLAGQSPTEDISQAHGYRGGEGTGAPGDGRQLGTWDVRFWSAFSSGPSPSQAFYLLLLLIICPSLVPHAYDIKTACVVHSRTVPRAQLGDEGDHTQHLGQTATISHGNSQMKNGNLVGGWGKSPGTETGSSVVRGQRGGTTCGYFPRKHKINDIVQVSSVTWLLEDLVVKTMLRLHQKTMISVFAAV